MITDGIYKYKVPCSYYHGLTFTLHKTWKGANKMAKRRGVQFYRISEREESNEYLRKRDKAWFWKVVTPFLSKLKKKNRRNI